jgi:hypothetical protein
MYKASRGYPYLKHMRIGVRATKFEQIHTTTPESYGDLWVAYEEQARRTTRVLGMKYERHMTPLNTPTRIAIT